VKIAWLIVGIIISFATLLALLQRAKKNKVTQPNDLSLQANLMMNEFSYYYSAPFAGNTFNSLAQTTFWSGLLLAIYGAIFEKYWLGIGYCVGSFILLIFIAKTFDARNWLVDQVAKDAHEEILKNIYKG
jgi:high-affinity Fe2+/Pb2+ permease